MLGRNELVADESGRVVAKDTGEREKLPAQLVVRAVGYRGVPMPGLPFDERSRHHPACRGPHRAADATSTSSAGSSAARRGDRQQQEGFAGHRRHAAWPILRGAQLRELGPDYADELVQWLLERQPKLVTDDHWQLIDTHERSAGEPHGRPRVKIANVAELLRIARG